MRHFRRHADAFAQLVLDATSKPRVQTKERLSPGARLSSFCAVAALRKAPGKAVIGSTQT
jgi:hypothetical protein